MTTTTETVTTETISSWKVALGATRAAIAELDRELLDVSSAALAGDGPAVERRAQLLDERARLQGREDELDSGIRSGELHLQRQAEEAREAERAVWRNKAKALREDQVQAAKRFDRALARLGEAWDEFRSLELERESAVKRSGAQWVRRRPTLQLDLTLWHGAPSIAGQLKLDRRNRTRGVPLEDLV